MTGYRAGVAELAAEGEPRSEFDPTLPLTTRYRAKAAELDVTMRTVQNWVSGFRRDGEAGLISRKDRTTTGSAARTDQRWLDTVLEVMVEDTEESKPSRTMVIDQTTARVTARFGPGAVKVPSRATAFRLLEVLERRHPTFRLSAKRNRDIADRPDKAYGKLRPTRSGEYVLMDTTRLDVFALDPVTLRWMNSELTVAMVRPVCRGVAAHADVDEVGGRSLGAVPGVSAPTGWAGLAFARGVARAWDSVRKAVVAHQVHQLEHAVGTKLLTTALDAAGIRLTAAGEEFAEEVLPVLAMLDRAATEARTSADQKPRSVRAVLPTSERAVV